MLHGIESMAYAALQSVVGWIKDVNVGEHLEEFHLCPRFMFDGNEADIDQRPMIEQVILPSLLELQAYLTQDKYRKPPRVKISVNCARDEDLEFIRASLARLETSGLDVNSIGESQLALGIANHTYPIFQGKTYVAQGYWGHARHVVIHRVYNRRALRNEKCSFVSWVQLGPCLSRTPSFDDICI